MIKTLVKLVVVVLVANAIWRIGSAYITFYKFEDAVTEVAGNSKGKTDEELRDKVMELASSYDEPVSADAITIQRLEQHTVIETSYTRPVSILPGYDYAWPFDVHADGYVVTPERLNDLAHPQ
jgi:hypothetical protein